MARTLTITMSDDLYAGLQERVGPDAIDRFIEDLVRPHLSPRDDLETAYRTMAADEEREREALEWIEHAPAEVLRAKGAV